MDPDDKMDLLTFLGMGFIGVGAGGFLLPLLPAHPLIAAAMFIIGLGLLAWAFKMSRDPWNF